MSETAVIDDGAFEAQLRRAVRGEVYFDDVTRGIYSTDSSIYQIKPLCVVTPLDETDVIAAVKIAAAGNVPITARGAATSLGGQAVGRGMILDTSRHMSEIIETNIAERWIRVGPGVILGELNAALAADGMQFAPDPATGNRATIGGMVGNNASGTKSILYGITQDYVQELKVALADGAVLEFGKMTADEYERRCAAGGTEARILSGFREIIRANREEIKKRYPKVMRRVLGYNLDAFVGDDSWNLSELIVGSEGTLAVVLEAKLRLEPLPKYKAMCTVHFAELIEAIRAVEPIVEYGPSAVEILDEDVIRMARGNLGIAPLCGFVEGAPKGILIVEFFADTPGGAAGKVEYFTAEMKRRQMGYAAPIIDPAKQADVWNVRKNGLGLLLAIKGDRKPIAFIEDCCVPVSRLPEYIEQILAFCKDRGVLVAMYAHASVGVIHVRPILNLKVQEDIDHMKAIAEKAFELVTGYGGAWSGEHGDGRIRSPFLRRFFGDQVYDALGQVKRLFDPAGLMNPGVIIDPGPMDRDLRYGTDYKRQDVTSVFHFRSFGSFAAGVEQCNGVAACRQTLTGTMCPSYRATLDERHSPRGRANTLRLAMTGEFGPDALAGKEVAEVMDLCLSCKACKAECPSGVDIARLKSEYKQKCIDERGASFRDKLMAATRRRSEFISGWKAPIVNWFQRRAIFKRLMGWICGIDHRRSLPAYARVPFDKWFAKHTPAGVNAGGRNGKVVLFDDTYISYYQPEVGISAVELLEACGYEVIRANAGCCQRLLISHGFLRKAKRLGEQTLRNLDKYFNDGLKVVVCEPSCASALTDDLPDLIDDEDLGERIKQGVMMIDVFLAQEIEAGRVDCKLTSPFEDIIIHGHCHQKALYGTIHMSELLRGSPVNVREIDAGCCGMGGSFGYEVEHYQTSMDVGEASLFPAVRKRPQGAAVVACGFSCRHQIADGTGVKAMHWVQAVRAESDNQEKADNTGE